MEKLIIELERNKHNFENNESFVEGEKYWNKMKSEGLTKEDGYIISPLDTIGRGLYNNENKLSLQSKNHTFIK